MENKWYYKYKSIKFMPVEFTYFLDEFDEGEFDDIIKSIYLNRILISKRNVSIMDTVSWCFEDYSN